MRSYIYISYTLRTYNLERPFVTDLGTYKMYNYCHMGCLSIHKLYNGKASFRYKYGGVPPTVHVDKIKK